jgi:mono/diheme cytochrome c family protein
MTSIVRFGSAVMVTFVVCAAAAAQTPPQQAASASAETATPPGNAENGKALYKKVGCYECHGIEAQGGPGTGPRLGPDGPNFARLSSYIRKPAGAMPPYRAPVLSDKDVADIYAYVKSVPKPPALASIPLLAPAQFK